MRSGRLFVASITIAIAAAALARSEQSPAIRPVDDKVLRGFVPVYFTTVREWLAKRIRVLTKRSITLHSCA